MRLNTSMMLSFYLWSILVGSMVKASPDTSVKNENGTTVTLECRYHRHGVEKHIKTVDTSRCFYGDLCCCNLDAFDIADLLLTERESVFTGRIEEVQALPESLLVRRDVNAVIHIEKVFRGNEIKPSSKIDVRLTSDMFIWEQTGQSRIVARQTLANEHDAKSMAIYERLNELAERNTRGELEADEYARLKGELESEWEQLEELRWDWEGEIGVITSGRDGPATNCNDGRFTTDRFGVLRVGTPYLFALDISSTVTDDVYHISDKLWWSIFWGDEMNDVVHALNYTSSCLSWPEIVYEPGNEQVAIDICADWARGATRPGIISRRH